MSVASPSATRAVLERFGLTLKHGLGQHFLVNRATLGRIVGLAAVAEGERVLEVGPGIGTLTQALLSAGARVVAVERDATLLPALAYTCEPWAGHFRVIEGDALALSPLALEEASAALGVADAPFQLIANLPYNVAATVVLDYFDRFDPMRRAVVMVQREVAARFGAKPGAKDYGAYTVKLALRAEVGASFTVPPSAFMPPPHVDSAVVELTRREPALDEEVVAAASTMADAAFFHRRKTIANSLRGYFAGRKPAGPPVDELLAAAGVDPAVRGEKLAPETYVALGRALLADRALKSNP